MKPSPRLSKHDQDIIAYDNTSATSPMPVTFEPWRPTYGRRRPKQAPANRKGAINKGT